ncbi:MAG: hypothetical protein ACI9TV_003196 [Sulfurimonas sp.]|jgi:hypothetical protein
MGIISGKVYNGDYFTIKYDGSLVKDTIEGTIPLSKSIFVMKSNTKKS